MILFLFVILLVLLSIHYRKEPFRTKKSSMTDIFINMSPLNIVDVLYKRIHPYIPYKQKYYKWKRYLRYR